MEIIVKSLVAEYRLQRPTRVTRVFDSVTLDFPTSKISVILGPSASGKSTLLKLIGNFCATIPNCHVEGEILLGEYTPHEARMHGKIGIAFQTPTLFEWRNVKQNIQLPLDIRGSMDYGHLHFIMKIMGIEEYTNSPIWSISGGTLQRVNIARAMVHKPELLLLDEPFGNLDEITRESIAVQLRTLQAQLKQTMVMVTHNIKEAAYFADHLYIFPDKPIKNIKKLENPLINTSHHNFESQKFYDFIRTVRRHVDAPNK